MQYYYDDAGRLLEAHSPEGKAEYTYETWGSRKSLTLPNGVVTSYSYDDMLRLTRIKHVDSQSTLLASFNYEVV